MPKDVMPGYTVCIVVVSGYYICAETTDASL